MESIATLPELTASSQFIRIPSELDVPITDRVRKVIDSPAMQRLKEISQLGLVSTVYPGAVHSRFEHSLGVFRLACIVLKHLSQIDPGTMLEISDQQGKIFLLAALLHDIGHWPYCHPIEDMRLPEVVRHEVAAKSWITQGSLAQVIRHHWQVEPEAVADFLSKRSTEPALAKLQNVLNGPVDIDKMDYLQRDSLHAGVPYGRNFDVARLVSSLRFSDSKLVITPKGKTAAEMMVFSRYVMFSEVYWHHSVRSATAMLQRAVYRLRDRLRNCAWHGMSDSQFQQLLVDSSLGTSSQHLVDCLFGRKRQLYKRFSQHNFAVSPEVHAALAHRPFEQLLRCSDRFADELARQTGTKMEPDDILIDAPPVKLEIQFKLDIGAATGLQPLADVSPVVRALATDQFDKFVKQVRVFVRPELRERLQVDSSTLTKLLLDCAQSG